MTQHILTPLTDRPIPQDLREIRLFNFVRNERARIVYFLDYHRKLGVNRFLMVDDHSTDGTREFLLAQPDVHVFTANTSYKEAKSGIGWTKALCDQYGVNQWCLLLDADELLVYPACETTSLRTLCDRMEQEGSEALYTFMLDMYGPGQIEEAVCAPGQSFFEICPFFDRSYHFVKRIHLRGAAPFPPLEVLGGPRARCFYPPQGEHSYLRRLVIHLAMQITHILRTKYKLPLAANKSKAPALFKVPLIRWQTAYAYTASTHELNPVRLSATTGVLAHFKFFADFHARAQDAVARKAFAGDSAEYQRYLDGVTKGGVNQFMYAGSTRYRDSQQLVELGLMKVGQ